MAGDPTPVAPLDTPSVATVGPYSAAVRAGDWIVCSGQIGVDPTTGKFVGGGIEAEVRQALANVTAVLGDCGLGWEHVAKATLFVATASPQWMSEVNTIYAEVLGEHRPARSTVGVAWLPLGATFEIEVWAHAPA
jgi:2-iminobutanoate/2-iminopropanoate deaminase